MQNENFIQNEEQGLKTGFSGWLFDWAEALVTALITIVIIFAFIVRINSVDGSSMLPTLYDKDTLIVSNLFYQPKYGDIVVITKKSFMEKPIVKRVIATEGQLVNIDFDNNTVSVDGTVLKEDYIREPTQLSYDVKFPVVVPKGCIFVMGDNRNESTDSRDSRVGFIDKRQILGHVILRIFPIKDFGPVK